MIIRNRKFEGHTYIMGILNITPDSFSDGGKWNDTDRALFRAERMISEGADVIDIGGESTRPGYLPVSDEEEAERVVPIIRNIRKNFDIPISVDTYKSSVATAALEAGADLVNDIWGLKHDDEMARVIKNHNAVCCLMHNRGDSNYTDFFEDISNDINETIEKAKKVGISDDKIILDPGVGFAKTTEQNLWVTAHLEKFDKFGYPLLLGTSRKSMIGNTLDLPVDERVEGTLVTTVTAVQKKCLFVRVHDIKENVRAIKMTEALMNI